MKQPAEGVVGQTSRAGSLCFVWCHEVLQRNEHDVFSPSLHVLCTTSTSVASVTLRHYFPFSAFSACGEDFNGLPNVLVPKHNQNEFALQSAKARNRTDPTLQGTTLIPGFTRVTPEVKTQVPAPARYSF